MRIPSALTVAAVLFCVLLVPVQAQQDPAVGSVSALQGEAYAIRADLAEVDLAPGVNVFRTDTVQTLINALLEIEMIDGSRFTLDENTRIEVAEYVTDVEPRGRMELLRGRMRATVSALFSSRSDSFQVQTAEAVMGVQGTDFLVDAAPGETTVYVYDGLVLVTSRDPAYPDGVLLGPGQFIRVRLGEPLGDPVPFRVIDVDPDEPISSGGDQQMRSGGDQADDPLQLVPEFPPRRPDQFDRPPPDTGGPDPVG